MKHVFGLSILFQKAVEFFSRWVFVYLLVLLFIASFGFFHTKKALPLMVNVETTAAEIKLNKPLTWSDDLVIDSGYFRVEGVNILPVDFDAAKPKNQSGRLEVYAENEARIHLSDLKIPANSVTAFQLEHENSLRVTVELDDWEASPLEGRIYLLGAGRVCRSTDSSADACAQQSDEPGMPQLPFSIPFTSAGKTVEFYINTRDSLSIPNLGLADMHFWDEKIGANTGESPFECGVQKGDLAFKNLSKAVSLWGNTCLTLKEAKVTANLEWAGENISMRAYGNAITNEQFMPRRGTLWLESEWLIFIIQLHSILGIILTFHYDRKSK